MTNTSASGPTAFLNVFLVWHPKFQDGDRTGLSIGESLFREFSRDPDAPMSPAIGIPIYFRTSARTGQAPAPIDLAAAQHNMVVFLTNASMVLDETYRNYVETIATASGLNTRILSLVAPGSGKLNVRSLQEVQLPDDPKERAALIRLKIVSECCRFLQNRPRSGDPEGHLSREPAQLFISHAKRDAANIAEELRLKIQNASIDTFFDRVDIAPGYDFSTELRESIKRSAVIAWQSDEYASRPWCNIELLTAKEHLRPIVVVSSLKKGEERSFPYLGNVRTLVADAHDTNEIIIAAAREYLRKLYSDGLFELLAAQGSVPKAEFCLFRPPEPVDAALIQRKSADNEETTVLYPDPPISTIESGMLKRLFPNIRFITPGTANQQLLTAVKVALSISLPESDELAAGMSPLHLQAAMIEVARHILTRGGIIAYGGDLREKNKYGFTRQLFDLVRVYDDLHRGVLERIWNFLAFSSAAELPEEEESRLITLAQFKKVLPSDVAKDFALDLENPIPVPDDNADHRYVRARCFTELRERMAKETDARIIFGGRTVGQQGLYPGILEESVLTLEADKPLYVIGAFGGCARLVAECLRDKTHPEAFHVEYQRQHPRKVNQLPDVPYEELEASFQKRGKPAVDFDHAVSVLTECGVGGLNNGLSVDDNKELFVTPDLNRIVTLLIKGLNARFSQV